MGECLFILLWIGSRQFFLGLQAGREGGGSRRQTLGLQSGLQVEAGKALGYEVLFL